MNSRVFSVLLALSCTMFSGAQAAKHKTEPAAPKKDPAAAQTEPAASKTDVATETAAILPPGDNLVVEGIPPVPMDLVDQVDKYTNFRSASLTNWHPEKRQILINTRFADTQQVHEVKMPYGARSQLTFFRDSAGAGMYQPIKQPKYLVFTKDKGGDEFYQKFRYDIDSKEVTRITDGKSRNTGGVWSTYGDLIAYGSTRRTGNDVDIYTVDPSDPKTDKMIAQLEGGGWAPLDWSKDDKTLLVEEEVSANESYLWTMNSTSGEKKLLTPKNEDAKADKIHYGTAVFSKDGKGVYLTTDKDSEFERLAYMDLSTQKIKFLTTDLKWNVEELALSWDGRMIAFTSNEDGKSLLHLWDTAGEVEVPAPQNIPAGQVSGIEWHRNNKDLGFMINSAKSPGDVYSTDVKMPKVERWTKSETGGINTTNFSEPELIHWKTFDGKMMSGFLYKPPAKFTGRRPVVINIHGGPEGQARPGFLGKNNYLLNELGVAIVFPNIRGSSGYGKTFLKLDNGMLREDTYKDVSSLIDYIKARFDLDSNRVMVMGGSYGGHMTLAMSAFYSDKIRCAMAVVGPSNLVTFLENTQGYRRDLRRVEYGDERDKDMRAFLEKIAPSNNADKIKKPLFVVQGKNDPRVPASESIQMVEAVRKNGTPVWFLMANDEGHGFAKKKNNDFMFYSEVLFMQKYLLND
jgi:dipeptidyl aminopeptidase/acylaminoacyl peptidase